MASTVYVVRGVLIPNNFHPSLRDAVEEAQRKGIVVALFPALVRVEHIPNGDVVLWLERSTIVRSKPCSTCVKAGHDCILHSGNSYRCLHCLIGDASECDHQKEMEKYKYGSKPICYDYKVARQLELTPVPKEFRWADKRKQSSTLLADVLRSAQDDEGEEEDEKNETPAIALIEDGSASEDEDEDEEDQLVSDDEPAPAKGKGKGKGKAQPARRTRGSQGGKADGESSKKSSSRKRKVGQTGQTDVVKHEPKKTKKDVKDSSEDMLLRLLANSEEALEIARELLKIERSKSATQEEAAQPVAGPSGIRRSSRSTGSNSGNSSGSGGH
ncbi:hypothetical protein OH76DRAFT_1421380 [Lentinus brumalis]|uniref:Uncharacterized protein n=1 Tax=Lentinus brumalis TaxID=2498619 RepID=A0A371CW60_9APHY|nr:hypothetical protein OH76DRAFT_1421380 [Polyporus brumalis]